MKHTLRSIVVVVSILVSGVAFAVPEDLEPPPGVSEADFRRAYEDGANLQVVYRAIYNYVRPAVVRVEAENIVTVPGGSVPPALRRFFPDAPQQERRARSFGTGFVIDESGLIATNAHVVGDASRVSIHLADERVLEGRVLGKDDMTDVAVIKVDASDLRALRFADSDNVAVGDVAIAVGNPFGLDGTFTTGVVSGVHRGNLDETGMKFIQTDASINQGNSGGPLLNLRGEVIGINRMIFSQSGGSNGIGFAIPTNTIQPIVQRLARGETIQRPFLGVQIAPVPPQFAEQLGTAQGAVVAAVVQGSGAWQAGVSPKDVIIKIDNVDVKTPEELVAYVRARNIGDVVELKLLREREVVSVRAEIKPLD